MWAIPSHPTDSRAAGPNSLIKSGVARLCSGVQDFFDSDDKQTENKKMKKNSENDLSLIDKIGMVPVSESVLAEVVGKTVSEIKSELVILELQGLVRKVDGGYVRL